MPSETEHLYNPGLVTEYAKQVSLLSCTFCVQNDIFVLTMFIIYKKKNMDLLTGMSPKAEFIRIRDPPDPWSQSNLHSWHSQISCIVHQMMIY